MNSRASGPQSQGIPAGRRAPIRAAGCPLQRAALGLRRARVDSRPGGGVAQLLFGARVNFDSVPAAGVPSGVAAGRHVPGVRPCFYLHLYTVHPPGVCAGKKNLWVRPVIVTHLIAVMFWVRPVIVTHMCCTYSLSRFWVRPVIVTYCAAQHAYCANDVQAATTTDLFVALGVYLANSAAPSLGRPPPGPP